MLKKTIKNKINIGNNKKKHLIRKSKKKFNKKIVNKKTRKILNNVNDRKKTKKNYNKLVGGAEQLQRTDPYIRGETLAHFNEGMLTNPPNEFLDGYQYIVVTTLALATHIILIGEQAAEDIETFMNRPNFTGPRPVDRSRLFSSLEMDEQIQAYINNVFEAQDDIYFTIHRDILGDIKNEFIPVRIRHDFSLLILMIQMFTYFIYRKKLSIPEAVIIYLRNLYPTFRNHKPRIEIIHPDNRISTDIRVVENLVNEVKYNLTRNLKSILGL